MVNIFKHTTNPIHQASIVAIAACIVMLCAFLIALFSSDIVSPTFYWLTATSFMLFYTIFNTVSSLGNETKENFWSNAIYSYLGLAIVSGLLAWLFSGLTIFEAGSYAWLFKVVTFVYLVFVSLVKMIKVIVEFAQKEQWNSPKLRKKNRRD